MIARLAYARQDWSKEDSRLEYAGNKCYEEAEIEVFSARADSGFDRVTGPGELWGDVQCRAS